MGPTHSDSEQLGRSSGSSEESPRSSCGSEVIMISNRASQPVTRLEHIQGNVNMTKCSKVHIRPESVKVTQNFENAKEGRDLPFHRFIWDVAKNTTKLERLSCVAATLILITCIVLIVYYTAIDRDKEKEKDDDETPDWYIDRRKWGAMEYNKTTSTKDNLRLVIIAHTVTSFCTTYIDCSAIVKKMQSDFLKEHKYDIPYNFLIGGDGMVYEGRGWNIVGAHTRGYNSCSVGIGFIGDYRYSNVTDLQQKRARILFEEGVKNGNLRPSFHVLGHLDLTATLSPGENLYKVIRTWPNYDHENLYKSLSCQQIDDL